MRYIKVKNKKYAMEDAQRSVKTDLGEMWLPVHPEPMRFELSVDGIKEWFIHTILGKHFTFGQDYCVMCGREDVEYTPPQRNY